MTGIAAYRRAAQQARARLAGLLGDGRAAASAIALTRVMADHMDELLATAPGSVLVYDRMGPDPQGFSGPDRWEAAELRRAAGVVHPHEGVGDEVTRKYEQYLNLSLEMPSWGQVRQELVVDRHRGRQYLIFGADPVLGRVMQVVSSELMVWFRAQPETRRFLDLPARAGLGQMLSERPDLVALVRLAETLPLDVEISDVPVDRPAVVEAIELAIGLVPVVGSAVALYEAWAGVDLFGYHLTDVERGILAATAILPTAGRLARGGRALYTEARLVALYGRDAAAWSRAVAAGTRGGAQGQALRTVERAERELRVSRTIPTAMRREAAAAVPAVARGAAVSAAVDPAVLHLLRDLHARNPALRSLDAPALMRVLEKGTNPSHLKGQLLEELLESRIVPWLQAREGAFALGLTVPAGKKLEFVPGHIIRDLRGLQITDGILAYRDTGRLVILAVFEAKAGPHAARELSLARGSRSSLTQAEREELRAYARDVWRDRRDAARAEGRAFGETVDGIEQEMILSERGGQVRRDIERLAASDTGASMIRVGAERLPVVFSPTRTKFFGVLPRGARTATIEAQLRAENVTFEMLAADLTSSQLDAVARDLAPHARRVGEAPVAP